VGRAPCNYADSRKARASVSILISSLAAGLHNAAMNWKSIRLELAWTSDFPRGSPSRAYLLRLPLGDDGLIDEPVLSATPARATVRRFWPNQPDMTGYVVRANGGWVFSYEPGQADDEAVFHLENHPLRLGEYVTLNEPDGQLLQFRVASIERPN
jgi:hypothetical protein